MTKGSAILSSELWFPPATEADEDGLLAIGGDLSVNRLLLAYKNGIFPWYDGELPLWWNPNPRFVLFPVEINISKSMRQIINRNQFGISCNKHFLEVITQCKNKARPGQDGTWISDEVIAAYTQLHILAMQEAMRQVEMENWWADCMV